MKPMVWVISALFALSMAVSCRDSASYLYTDFRSIPQSQWRPAQPITFDISCRDSLTQRAQLTVVVRHDNFYPHRDITLWVDVIDTAFRATRHRLNIVLADENGQWRSRGFGSVYEASASLSAPVNPQAIRRVVMWNGINDSILYGISDVGLSISQQ